MDTRQRGFSLIELLIVVAIILIIAAIAIPDLLTSKMRANEASAASSMRLISSSAVAYRTAHPDIGYAAKLTDLGPAPAGDGYIDALLVGGSKAGYKFSYTPTQDATTKLNEVFTLTGDPTTCDKTGRRTYFTDEGGIVRFESKAGCPAATTASPPLN